MFTPDSYICKIYKIPIMPRKLVWRRAYLLSCPVPRAASWFGPSRSMPQYWLWELTAGDRPTEGRYFDARCVIIHAPANSVDIPICRLIYTLFSYRMSCKYWSRSHVITRNGQYNVWVLFLQLTQIRGYYVILTSSEETPILLIL